MKEEILNILKNTISILPFIWMYYAPAHIVMLFLLLIICWDTVLGIKASKKTGRKKEGTDVHEGWLVFNTREAALKHFDIEETVPIPLDIDPLRTL